MITKKQAAQLISHASIRMSSLGSDQDVKMYLQLAAENGDEEVKALLAKHSDLPQRMAQLAEMRIAVKTQEKDLKRTLASIMVALDPPLLTQDEVWEEMDHQSERSD